MEYLALPPTPGAESDIVVDYLETEKKGETYHV
jgi:hypothetical protein